MRLRSQWLSASLFAALGMQADAVLAADDTPLNHDFEVSLGGFFMSTKTNIRLDGQNGVTGTDIDLSRDLGIDDKNRMRLDGFWRFAERHKMRFMYYDNDRSGTRTLSRDITFGDYTFPLNARVDANLDTQIFEVAYEYAFLRRDKVELSGSFGIHEINVSTVLAGTASIGGNANTSGQVRREASTDGPLPVMGVHVIWNMGGDFYLDGLGQFFYVKVNEFEGRLSSFKIAATWQATEHFGMGIGYDDFITSVDVSKSDFTGRLRFANGGALAFLTVGF